ncbi:MAG: substrate-binding periplasmic protein [Lachnospiraceae bacterium]
MTNFCLSATLNAEKKGWVITMKKWGSFMLAVIMIFCLTACQNSKNPASAKNLTLEKGILKVGMYMHLAPMASVTEDTVTPVGFEVELAQAIASSLGLKIQFVDITRDNLLPSLDADIVDCVISSVAVTEENPDLYCVSQPYADLSLIQEQLPETVEKGKIAIYTSSDREQLMQYLDQTLDTLKDSGDISALSQIYFETDITPVSEEKE